jgi:YfiH family protein
VAVGTDPAFRIIQPEWDVPSHVHAVATTRYGGVSTQGYQSLNLADHVNDDVRRVSQNRQLLATALDLPQDPRWIAQEHSSIVVCADHVDAEARVEADAAWTDRPGTVCAVLTADCLPVLLCDAAGTMVAAVHAGWRGLSAGILDQTLDRFFSTGIAADQIKAWLGPAIGPAAYEVDAAVRDVFLRLEPVCRESFLESRPGHWQLDLYAAASAILGAQGVIDISGGNFCTYTDEQFFSYRQEQVCGRQASLIWLDMCAAAS